MGTEKWLRDKEKAKGALPCLTQVTVIFLVIKYVLQ